MIPGIPSDAVLAGLQADAYAVAPAGRAVDAGPDRAVLTCLPGLCVATIRGTVNPRGWWSDFQIAPRVARSHPCLGECEAGFLDGAEALYAVLRPLLDGTPLLIQGHSRGAPIAAMLAGLLICDCRTPVRCVCWEKPWGNGPQLRALLAESGMPGVEYWHGDDPVPLVPAVPWLVMSNFPIRHFGRWTVDPFASHLMAGIVADATELAAA